EKHTPMLRSFDSLRVIKIGPQPQPRALSGVRLEVKFGRKLHDTEAARATAIVVRVGELSPVSVLGHCQGGRGISGPWPGAVHVKTNVPVIEVGMIEGIERFQSKLEISSLIGSEGYVLEQRHVPILKTARSNHVTSSASRRPDGREDQVSRGIERVVEAHGAPLVRAIEVPRWERTLIVQVHGRASHKLRNTTQLEVVGNVRKPFRAAEVFRDIGQIVDIVSGKYMGTIP